MIKKIVYFGLCVAMIVPLCSCGASGIPQATYDAVVQERDALQVEVDTLNAEVAELQQNTVSKDEYDKIKDKVEKLQKKYDSVAEERDKLKEEIEKSASNETESNANEGGLPFSIPTAPFSATNMDGVWDVESFEITDIEDSDDKYRISYVCKGVFSERIGFLKFFCYDNEGYQVDKFSIHVSTNAAGQPFKDEDFAYISKSTVRIGIE